MNPNLKADSIQIKDISSAVAKAVKLVGDKHKVQFENGLAINPAIINGRILREIANLDLKGVNSIAEEITHEVQAAHAGLVGSSRTLTPTVLMQKGHIICGFVAQPPAIFLGE